MTENLIIISVIGLIIGLVLSIPAGGPTSIVIFTNALKGRTRYCNLINFGAALADFTYPFISVFCLTKIYSLYKPYIPYVFLAGALFVIYTSIKIFNTKLDIEESNPEHLLPSNIKIKKENGFLTGMMLGFLNPGLFISSMTSSLLVLTILTSYGFDTGGLDKKMSEEMKEIRSNDKPTKDTNTLNLSKYIKSKIPNPNNPDEDPNNFPSSYPFWLSFCYAFFIAIGSVSWFYYLTYLISKFRKRIKSQVIDYIIKALGFILFLIGLLLGYKGIAAIL